MGPMAGSAFLSRLIELTGAGRDQDNIPVIVWNDPRIPGRTAGYSGMGPDPLPWMQHGVRQLVSAGACAIAIPCNTAHLWYEEIARSIQVPVLHIVQATIETLRADGVGGGRIGLMGTAATLKTQLYQSALLELGYECVVPTDEEIDRYCTAAIKFVTLNSMPQALACTTDCINLLRERGADAVVLGCTELPLALPHIVRPGLKIHIVDSIDALALAALKWYRS